MDEWDTSQRQAFGLRLKRARQSRHLTLIEVGAMFDLSKQAVSHWETGHNMPSAEQVARLADEYGASCDWLLLGQKTAAFSHELMAKLQSLAADQVRRLENGLRGQLDMGPLPFEVSASGQPVWKRRTAA